MPSTVLVSTRFFDPSAEALLRENGLTVRRTGLPDDVQDDALDQAQLDRLLEGVEGWIVGTAPVRGELIRAHPQLKVIARRGVGYNNVDIEAARELGVCVAIAPGGNDASVADHALGMMLGVAKRLKESHRALEGGRWSPVVGMELFEKTVGLVGFGRIAQAVAKRLRGFDARVLAYDPFPNRAAAERLGVELVELPALLRESDYVSLHLPLTRESRRMIDRDALAAMKPGSILINTSRGGLVDEEALKQALMEGRLYGAGLDVFEGEGDDDSLPAIRELIGLPNVMASAHAAGSSNEGLSRTNRIAAQTVIDVLRGVEPPAQCVVVKGAR